MAEKTEKKSGGGQIIKLALVLFAVSAIMALALGLVYEVTKDTIAMRAAETTKNAYANVLQADDYAEQADFENDGTITKLSVATTGGEQTGYVAETTFSGAQGMITMVVGLDSGKSSWQIPPSSRGGNQKTLGWPEKSNAGIVGMR